MITDYDPFTIKNTLRFRIKHVKHLSVYIATDTASQNVLATSDSLSPSHSREELRAKISEWNSNATEVK